jgi:ankyrin repeat protein
MRPKITKFKNQARLKAFTTSKPAGMREQAVKNLQLSDLVENFSSKGDLESLKTLFLQKPHLKTCKGAWSGLIKASQKGHFEVVEFLLKNKVKPWAMLNEPLAPSSLDELLVSIVETNNTKIAGLLISYGCNVNHNGGMPLRWAASLNQKEMIKELLAHGADLSNDQALFWANEAKHKDMVKLLLGFYKPEDLKRLSKTKDIGESLKKSVSSELGRRLINKSLGECPNLDI